MSNRRPEVFVSATSADLRTCRQLVKDALLTLGCVPVEQGNFPPDYRKVRDMLRSKIAASDAVIHLAGDCYGAEPATRPPNEPRRSYTQLEFDLARELRKPLYVFLCGDGFPYDAHALEDDDKRELQRAHRAVLGASETMRTKVASRDDLAMRVRELQTHVDSLTRELQKTRSWLGRGVFVSLVLLVTLGGGIWWLKLRAERAERHTAEMKTELATMRDLVATVLERYNRQAAPGETLSPEQRLDRAVNSVADEIHQDAAGLRSQLENFVGQVRNDPHADLLDRARAQFAAHDFTAATATAQAAAAHYRDIAIAAESAGHTAKAREARTQESGALLVAGDAFKAQQRFAEAAEAYRAAGMRGERNVAWADAQWSLGYALFGQARGSDWSQRVPLLRQALACYAAAAEVRTRRDSPQEWARLQYHESLAQADLAAITPMPEHASLWSQTVAARRAALEVLTRTETPAEWAWITVELGHALIPFAWTSEGTVRTQRLAESIAAYRTVIAVTPRHEQPEGWLQLEGFLAATLRYFGWSAAEPERHASRQEAATIYRAMLEMQTRGTRPYDWATTQSNLGMVLCELAESSTGVERDALLEESVAAQRGSLEVFTRETTGPQWAASQQALGYALFVQAGTVSGADRVARIQDAIAADRAALEFFSPMVDANRHGMILAHLTSVQAALAQ